MIFSGCSTINKGAEKIQPPDKFAVSFETDDFQGKVSFDYMKKTEFVFNKPDSVAGLKVTAENRKLTAKYADMVFNSDIPQTNLINTVNDVVSDLILNNQSIEAVEENGSVKRTGKDYIVYQSKENGFITKIISGKHEINFIQK